MKKIKFLLQAVLMVSVLAVTISSCEYKKIADAEYFDEVIYMPAALHNIYMINAVPEPRGETPTPGNPIRFKVENDANKFNVLLGVYRSGVYSKGDVMVNIAVRTDTIQTMLGEGKLPAGTELLPADKYTIANSVVVKNGEDVGKFDLAVDLGFLKAGAPAKKYAIAVEVSSQDRKTNPLYATTIIVIDTKIIVPAAAFTFAKSATNQKQVTFTNTSQNAAGYSWNFGDGSAGSTDKSPVYTYTTAGNFNVTLTVKGITGDQVTATQSVAIQ